MTEYSKNVKPREGRSIIISGKKCSVCEYVDLDNDDDVWSAVGL